jgi:type II secretory pathway predicted ATPase ExeA
LWPGHWNLVRDPFAPGGSPYVSTPGHDEAVAQLVHAIAAGERRVSLIAESGMGKTIVLTRALAKAKTPSLRVALAVAPVDGPSLMASLARSLRLRHDPESSAARSWRALVDAARLIRAQRGRLVLAVDSAQWLDTPEARRDLDRLVHLDSGPEPIVTLIEVSQPVGDTSQIAHEAIPIPLGPLTRGETSAYLATKLRLAGRDAPTFTPRGLTCLHSLAGGVPGRLDRLARLALVAGGLEGVDRVDEEILARLEVDALSITNP